MVYMINKIKEKIMKKVKFLILCLIILLSITMNLFGKLYPIDFVKYRNSEIANSITNASSLNKKCLNAATIMYIENYISNDIISYNWSDSTFYYCEDEVEMGDFIRLLSYALLRGEYSDYRVMMDELYRNINLLDIPYTGPLYTENYWEIHGYDSYEDYRNDVYKNKGRGDEYLYYYLLAWHIMFSMTTACLLGDIYGISQWEWAGNQHLGGEWPETDYMLQYYDYIEFVENYKIKNHLTPIMYKAKNLAAFAIDKYEFIKNSSTPKKRIEELSKNFILYEFN